ncbi:hypothetical protein FSP39_021125 [Pinctada imbricata]|uniref:Uncharacterized protein n=1 Tax=Pinctada imbricata TaxID=66713 RepID=A0AA88Y8V4_PINIB|nr:hypothetical protein FSP39_021125 [Pinctada imbricata]
MLYQFSLSILLVGLFSACEGHRRNFFHRGPLIPVKTEVRVWFPQIWGPRRPLPPFWNVPNFGDGNGFKHSHTSINGQQFEHSHAFGDHTHSHDANGNPVFPEIAGSPYAGTGMHWQIPNDWRDLNSWAVVNPDSILTAEEVIPSPTGDGEKIIPEVDTSLGIFPDASKFPTSDKKDNQSPDMKPLEPVVPVTNTKTGTTKDNKIDIVITHVGSTQKPEVQTTQNPLPDIIKPKVNASIETCHKTRNCRTNHRPMPYPFPWYKTQIHVPYPRGNNYNPQYHVVPYPQPAPVDMRYIHRNVHWYRVQPPIVRPFPPNPQPPVNPIPIIDNNQGPGPIPDPKPVPVIPDPVIPDPVIPDPGPGPDPSRVDSAGSVSSDVGSQVLRQNSPTNPDGVIFLSNFNGGFPILSEVADPSVLGQRKTCSLRDSSCETGQQCVFTDYIKEMLYTCPDIPSVQCHCQKGCIYQDGLRDIFIPLGHSATVDKCGSTCSCNNMYGTPLEKSTLKFVFYNHSPLWQYLTVNTQYT